MCIQITKYRCHHEIEEKKECRWYRHDLISAQNERKKKGFLTNLFSRPVKVPCPLPTGYKELMHEDCPACVVENRKQRDRQPKEESAVMSQEEFERRRSEIKWNWICQACFMEERRIEHLQRDANGGTCCSRGADEFEAWGRRQGELSMKSRHPSRIPRASCANPSSAVGQPRHSHRHDPSYLTAKLDASKAATDNGWVPNLDGLEPHLVADFVNLTGMGPGSLPPPPPPPKSPEPFYEAVGIDIERWEGQRRTGRGSYPAPECPPQDPLPVRPLRPTSRTPRVSPVEAVRPAPRKPAQSTPSSTGRHASVSQVSSAPTRPARGSSTLETRVSAATSSPLPYSSTRSVTSSAAPKSSSRQVVASTNPFISTAVASNPARSSSRHPATSSSPPRSSRQSATTSRQPTTTSRQPATTSRQPATTSRQPATTSGPSTSSKQATTIASRSTTPRVAAARSSPSSSTKPLPKTPITSRHEHAALSSGRRVKTSSTRGPLLPQVTVDENGVSPPSSPLSSTTLAVSPMSYHALKGKKSVFHELKGEIDATMDCFSENEEGLRRRGRW